MRNTIPPSVGNTVRTDDAVSSRKRSKKSLKAVASVAATAIAVGSVGLTAANWTDSEVVGSELSSGHFDMEVSVDDGETWHTQTVENGALELSMSSIFRETPPIEIHSASTQAPNAYQEASGPWGPGETRAAEVLLRLSDDTTHTGAFQLDNMVSVEGSGDVDDYSWTIADTSSEFSDCREPEQNPWVRQLFLFEGDSLDEVRAASPYEFRATQRPLAFERRFNVGGLNRSHPALGEDVDSTGMALCFEVTSSTDLRENGNADAEWTLSVEQVSPEDMAYTNIVNNPEGMEMLREDMERGRYHWVEALMDINSQLNDLALTRQVFEDYGMLEFFPESFDWTADGVVDMMLEEFPPEEIPPGMDYGDLIQEQVDFIHENPESIQRERELFGVETVEDLFSFMYGKDVFERLVDRFDLTFPDE